MKTIIAGSRDIIDYELLKEAIKESGFEITQIISGGARGVDKMGERYARENNIPCQVVTANWDLYGRSAGLKRNKEMSEIGEALIAVTNGSNGTAHMISMAELMHLKIYIKKVNNLKNINGVKQNHE